MLFSSLTLPTVLILVFESDCAMGVVPRPLRRGVLLRKKYAWSRNFPEPNKLLLIRLPEWEPFPDDMEVMEGTPCSEGVVTELEERTD